MRKGPDTPTDGTSMIPLVSPPAFFAPSLLLVACAQAPADTTSAPAEAEPAPVARPVETPAERSDRADTVDEVEEISQEELERLTAVIRGEVEAVRELRFVQPVAVAVTDRAGFQLYAKRRLEATTTPEEIAALDTSAKLFGLIPDDLDYLDATLRLMESQVGGFYDPGEDKFYLMSAFSGGLARIILAHELTHALDDQHFHIDDQLEACKGNADAAFAFQAVVEGSGTAVMNRWTVQHMGELDAGDLQQAAAMGQDEMAEAPPFLWKPLLCVYLRGNAFLSRTDSVMKAQLGLPKMADVDRAFRQPPRSSEQILHPEKYWDETQLDPPVGVRARGEELPGGWTLAQADTLGEIGFALVFEDPDEREGLVAGLGALAAQYTGAASEGWGGDRYVLLERGDDRAVISFSVWDTEGDATEALAALQGQEAHLRDSALAYAKRIGASEGGFLVRRGDAPRTLVAISAAGADPKGLGEVFEALDFAVEAPQPK